MTDLLISKEVLEKMQVRPEELLIDLATYLYDKERLSMGQARRLSNLSVLAFQRELSKRNILIKFDETDLESDLTTIESLI